MSFHGHARQQISYTKAYRHILAEVMTKVFQSRDFSGAVLAGSNGSQNLIFQLQRLGPKEEGCGPRISSEVLSKTA